MRKLYVQYFFAPGYVKNYASYVIQFIINSALIVGV